MPKPAALYTWATSTNFAAGPAAGTPTKVAPSGGQQAEGFEPAEKPGAQNFNSLLGNLFEWAAYVNARWNSSDQLIGPLTVAGALTVSGGTLTVTGASTYVSAREYHFTVAQARQATVMAARPITAADFVFSANAWTHQGNNTYLLYGLENLEVGERLTYLAVYMKKNTSNATSWLVELYKFNNATATDTLVASTTYSGNATGEVAVELTGLTETIVDTHTYYVAIHRTAGAGTGDNFRNMQFDVDRV